MFATLGQTFGAFLLLCFLQDVKKTNGTATLNAQYYTAGTNEHVAAEAGFYDSIIYNNNNMACQRFNFQVNKIDKY